MLVSICIPCYYSRKTLPVVVDAVRLEFAKHPEHQYQMVLVNDGSTDGTFDVIRDLAHADSRIVGVNLMRNYGQASAKLAALQYVEGDAVVFMDDDGQHPAEGIFILLDKMQEGDYDVVYAHFAKKKASGFKVVTSNLHNVIAEAMGNKPKGVHRSSFSIWQRSVADALRDYHSPFVSVGSYLMHVTTKYADVPVEHRERIAGSSGYTLKRMVSMWLNIFFSFSMVPLRLATYFGMICTFVSLVGGIVLVVRKILHPSITAGYTSTIVVLVLIGGIIMVMLGIIGEYIGRIYITVSDMPQYRVREVVRQLDD